MSTTPPAEPSQPSAAASMFDTTRNTEPKDDDHDGDDDDNNGVTQSLPPSHILEDGRFIYLPPPSLMERSKFFERSIARHGLLQNDMMGQKVELVVTTAEEEVKEEDENKKDNDNDNDKTAPKVHPLAVASARLQANGLAELNRAINLAGLVTTGDYFGMTTIVDPSLETVAPSSQGGESSSATAKPAASAPQSSSSSSNSHSGGGGGDGSTSQEETTVKGLYVLKRKRVQFQKASAVLERHEKQLHAAIQAQRVLDRRLFQLRQHWRLVAPEHGTRARLHATRPTEVVAIDVDVYDRDRVGGGSQALSKRQQNTDNTGFSSSSNKPSLAGRLASRVPRFATIELKDDFKVDNNETKEDEEQMQVDGETGNESSNNEKSKFTRAEPFAVADPTVGRVMENFDPSKVPMLNLQLEIQKSSTGFQQSACLEPMTTLSVAQGESTSYAQDEELLVSLQHSLFCANLFENIRSELDPPASALNNLRFSPKQKSVPVAWLSCESEENFLPPPSMVVGGDLGKGLASLSVVHCHEGEVKVQLDAEYTLCVKLVEANEDGETSNHNNKNDDTTTPANTTASSDRSGSQSPAQLDALCRAILLHSQDVYHRHSLYLRERAKQKQREEAAKGDGPRGLARISKEDAPEAPRILQSCVSLGSKMLFEQRVRKALVRISKWLKVQTTEKITVDWLALSIFDLQSHLTLSFCRLVLDVNIVRDGMTITRIDEDGNCHKVKFHSDAEFELFLKLQLRRELRNKQNVNRGN